MDANKAQSARPGAVLTVAAGGRVETVFRFVNDSPDPAPFYIETVELPGPEWASGAGPASGRVVATLGEGSLRLTLTPPVTADVRDYSFVARVVSQGAVIGADIPLVLRVEPPVEAEGPLPVVEVENLPAAPPEKVGSAGATEAPGPPAEETSTAPIAEPVRRPVEEPPPPPLVPEPARVAREDPVRPAVAPSLPSSSGAAVREESEDTATPARQAPPDTDLTLVDIVRTEDRRTERGEDGAGQSGGEPSELNPKEGTVFAVRPGETLRVRFSFHNDSRGDRHYVLDEDHSLEPDWLTLVQDQVNITPNASGEVSLRLSPPPDAAPGPYPFTVYVGPLGGVLTPVPLTLSVLASPAVRLTVKQDTLKIGPLSSRAEFALAVASAGNADTAFRISVKAPETATDDEAAASTRGDLYAAPPWRYSFDQEVEDVRASSAGRTQPQAIRLRVERQGIWWFGRRETHTMRVAAVPVTDRSNSGKPEINVLKLTAIRRRLLPMTMLLLVPLLMLMGLPAQLVLYSGASDLQVTNALRSAAGYLYVLGTKGKDWQQNMPSMPMTAELKWKARPFSLLRLATTEEGPRQWLFNRRHVATEVMVASFDTTRTFEVSPGDNTSRKKVRFVPVKTDGNLELFSENRRLSETPYQEEVGEDKTKVEGRVVELIVPAEKTTPTRLELINSTGVGAGVPIVVWLVGRPREVQGGQKRAIFSLDGAPEDTTLRFLGAGTVRGDTSRRGQTIKITYIGPKPPDPKAKYELKFVTTDATHQVLRVKLIVKNVGIQA